MATGAVGSIGIPKLDRIMMNGIPRGYTIIAEGDPGAGIELFAKQFVSPAENPANTIYFTTDERTEDVLHVFQTYGWPTNILIENIGKKYYERVLVRELKASTLRHRGFSAREILDLATTRTTKKESIDFLMELPQIISALQPGYRVAVDNLDWFLQRYPTAKVISVIRTIKAHTQYNKGLTLFTMMKGSVELAVEREIEGIGDMVIALETRRIGNEFETQMVIKKFRNHPEMMAIITYRISQEAITPETVARIQ